MDEVVRRLTGIALIVPPDQIEDINLYLSDKRTPESASGLAAFLADHPGGFIQLLAPELLPVNRWFTEAVVRVLCVHPDPEGAQALALQVDDRMIGDPLDPTFRFEGRSSETDSLGSFVQLSYRTLYPLEVPSWQST